MAFERAPISIDFIEKDSIGIPERSEYVKSTASGLHFQGRDRVGCDEIDEQVHGA